MNSLSKNFVSSVQNFKVFPSETDGTLIYVPCIAPKLVFKHTWRKQRIQATIPPIIMVRTD